MTVVVGTAGHIDHGKTALLRALTGIDPDRLPEERRRGLTVDIGYAHGSPDGGPEMDFVDVPGHDRLVGNMLVGVGEIDAALLVVAADDGPRAQTCEHLGLLDAMRINDGVVVITKADLVDAARASEVAAAVVDALASTSLARAPVIAASSVTGAGLDRLRVELAGLRDRVEADGRPRHLRAWLAIDRAFGIHGRGVVVTGSARGAAITVGDALLMRPGSHRVRVRGVHVHDRPAEGPVDRGRVALNLAGIDLDTVRRGLLLTSDVAQDGPLGAVETDQLLVALWRPAALPSRLPEDSWPPRDGTQCRLHLGTDQVAVRLGHGGRLAAAGREDWIYAVLRLERAVATAIGESFVLRRPPPAGLLAGGHVLDTVIPRGRARPRVGPDRLTGLEAAVTSRQGEAIAAALAELRGAYGDRLAQDTEQIVRSDLIEAVTKHHMEHPGQAGLPLSAARAVVASALRPWAVLRPGELAALSDSAMDAIVGSEGLVREGASLRTAAHRPVPTDPGLLAAMDHLVELLDVSSPPALSTATRDASCPRDAVARLEQAGRIVVVDDDLAWSSAAYGRLRDLALSLAGDGPLTPAALRDATGSSRKYAMALLEDLDRRGILRRTSAGHVPGPRA